jgi:hypothetical protein
MPGNRTSPVHPRAEAARKPSFRFIRAHAGATWDSASVRWRASVHPRARGSDPSRRPDGRRGCGSDGGQVPLESEVLGSSARTRERLPRRVPHGGAARFIRAHAGATPATFDEPRDEGYSARKFETFRAGDRPHENSSDAPQSTQCAVWMVGSEHAARDALRGATSARARSRRLFAASRSRGDRFIRACAGTTPRVGARALAHARARRSRARTLACGAGRRDIRARAATT